MNETLGIGIIAPRFHVVDYLILVAMTVLSVGIGIFYGCTGDKQRTTKEYFKGNNKMSMIPVVLSLLASFISSNGMLGVPAEVYMYGFDYCGILIGAVVGIPLAAYAFLPLFYELQITSVYECNDCFLSNDDVIIAIINPGWFSLQFKKMQRYLNDVTSDRSESFTLIGWIRDKNVRPRSTSDRMKRVPSSMSEATSTTDVAGVPLALSLSHGELLFTQQKQTVLM